MNSFDKRRFAEIDQVVKKSVALKRKGEIQQARFLLESCLHRYKSDNPILLTPVYKSLAKILYIQGEYISSGKCYVEAIKRYEAINLRVQITECLIHLGCCSQEFVSSPLLDEYVLGLRGQGESPTLTDKEIIESLLVIGRRIYEEANRDAMLFNIEETPSETRPVDTHSKNATEQALSIYFYGKKLDFNRAPMAMNPGEAPPLVTIQETITMPCLLGKFEERSERIEPCNRGLQFPLDLAPSAVLCPYCFSLMFVNDNTNSHFYSDADLIWAPNDKWTIFGYATYPTTTHNHWELHNKIKNLTSGSAVLVATRLTFEAEKAFGLTDGKFIVMPAGLAKEELDSLLLKQADVAKFIIQRTIEVYRDGRYHEALGMIQRALVIDPENEDGNLILDQWFQQ